MEVSGSFTPRPLYRSGNRPLYQFDRRLGMPHSRSGCYGAKKGIKAIPITGRGGPVPQLPASNSNSSQGLNRSSPLTHSLTNQLAPFHSLAPLTALHSSLNWTRSVACYTLRADHIENTATSSTSIVALGPLPSKDCCLVVSRSLPSSGCISYNIWCTSRCPYNMKVEQGSGSLISELHCSSFL
jgi:hypothetical protein